MRLHSTLHKWLLSLILLVGCLSISAKEKEYVLFLSSVNAEEAWIHGFLNEIQKRFPYNKNIELHNYFLTVPVLKSEEEVRQAQANILQTYPTPPKAVIIVGDPGWLVSAPIFDGPWKDIPVILCYSRKRVPADLQTLLSKIPLTKENSIPIEEFNKTTISLYWNSHITSSKPLNSSGNFNRKSNKSLSFPMIAISALLLVRQ